MLVLSRSLETIESNLMARKKKRQEEGNPVGRPSEYDPIYCEMLLSHMANGYSFESFGGKAKVSKQTLYNWCEAHPEFLDAKKVAESASQLWWEEQGINGLHNETIKDGESMTVTRSINATLWIFNMKNRFRWRDKQKDEDESIRSINDRPLKDLTDEELDAL